jgi:hypothetical protein
MDATFVRAAMGSAHASRSSAQISEALANDLSARMISRSCYGFRSAPVREKTATGAGRFTSGRVNIYPAI